MDFVTAAQKQKPVGMTDKMTDKDVVTLVST